MFAANDKAAILVEALPYIQEFYGKTVVIKYGGNAMINEELKEKVMQDVALMKYVGIQPVIVHGGGPEITGFLGKVGKETEFISGLRVTDEETVEIAEMVLDGKINSDIVTLLNRRGVSAVGLSGKDANLIRAQKKLATVYEGEESRKVDIGYVGQVERIDTRLLQAAEARRYIEDGTLTGGMIPKVEACLRALDAGAAKTHIIDGRLGHSIILEIFTSAGIGTQVVK